MVAMRKRRKTIVKIELMPVVKWYYGLGTSPHRIAIIKMVK